MKFRFPSTAILLIVGVVLTLTLLLLSACQSTPATSIAPTVASTTAPSTAIAPTVDPTLIAAAPAPTDIPLTSCALQDAPPIAAPDAVIPASSKPEDAVQTFYESLKQKNFSQAVALFSDYSLRLLHGSRAALLEQFQKLDFGGYKVLDYQILDSRLLNDRTALVHVLAKSQTGTSDPQTSDGQLALRLENGSWRLNEASSNDANAVLVDDLPLSAADQTIKGVIVRPVALQRYTNQMRVIFCLDDNQSSGVLWGWGNEITAVFHFGTKTQSNSNGGSGVPFQAGQLYPDAFGVVNGFYETWPDSVTLGRFQFMSTQSSSLPTGTAWSYTFSVK